jgi:hypothetical protein
MKTRNIVSQRSLLALVPEDPTGHWPEGWIMPLTKRQAFMRQFPFVPEYIKCELAQVHVTGIDVELVEKQVQQFEHKLCYGNEYYGEFVYLLDSNGNLVTHKEKYHVLRYPKLWGFIPMIWEEGHLEERTKVTEGKITYPYYVGDILSIDELLGRLKEDAERVSMILTYHQYTAAVILHKAPKGMNVRQWLDYLRDEATVERERLLAAEAAKFAEEASAAENAAQ